MKTKITLMYVALLTIASAAPAVAQVLAKGEVTKQLFLCDDVIEESQRLSCFNAIVDKLKAAVIAPAAKNPADSASVPETPVVASIAAPQIDDFGSVDVASRSTREKESNVVDSIQAMIVRSWRNRDGRFSVELDNGQIWRETQGTRVGQPKVDKSVKITTGRWGGYRMKVENIKRIAWVRRTK